MQLNWSPVSGIGFGAAALSSLNRLGMIIWFADEHFEGDEDDDDGRANE